MFPENCKIFLTFKTLESFSKNLENLTKIEIISANWEISVKMRKLSKILGNLPKTAKIWRI